MTPDQDRNRLHRLEKENWCPSSVNKRGGEDQWRLKSFLSPPSAAIERKSEQIFVTPKPDRKEEDEMVQLLRGYPPYLS